MRSTDEARLTDMRTGKLAGVTEIAAMLGGLTRSRADQLSRQKGFPDPVDEIGGPTRPQRVWLVKDVEAWIKAHPRPTQKPKKENR